MRQIKCRIWDKILKGWSLNTQHWLHLRTEKMLFVTPEQGERYIFEQFTGRQDKNKIEIYEGDICNFKNIGIPEYKIGEVLWSRILMGWHIRSYYNGKEDGDFCGYAFNYISKSSIEIIGNIHENPELLEKK